MVKGESLSRKDAQRRKPAVTNYDHLKAIITIAKKNGWDLETLELIPKDIPAQAQLSLTRKQVMERNRLVKSILQRFSRILTPPVPADLEEFIRNKDETSWLPWEREAMEKVNHWKQEISKMKPEIVDELRRVMSSEMESA